MPEIFAKSDNRFTGDIVYTFSENIGMEVGIKKCGVLVIKTRKS